MDEIMEKQQRRRELAKRNRSIKRFRIIVMLTVVIVAFLMGIFSDRQPQKIVKPNIDELTAGSIKVIDTKDEEEVVVEVEVEKVEEVENKEERQVKEDLETKTQTENAESGIDNNSAEVIENIPDDKSGKWNLALVNPWNSIPPNNEISLIQLKNGQSVDERIYQDLQKMMDDCRAQGLSPLICSSYRTNEVQTRLFNNQVQKYLSRGYTKEDARTEAAKWVAVPGTSEHQLGLSVDIVATSNQVLDESQENTPEQKWLIKNCYKYGFILRYPKDKSDITGIVYEPWHYRYVGKDAAAEITEKGIALEEYLKVN